MSVRSHKETFVAFLDSMDSGTVLGVGAGRQPTARTHPRRIFDKTGTRPVLQVLAPGLFGWPRRSLPRADGVSAVK